jgi:hypothetical protein
LHGKNINLTIEYKIRLSFTQGSFDIFYFFQNNVNNYCPLRQSNKLSCKGFFGLFTMVFFFFCNIKLVQGHYQQVGGPRAFLVVRGGPSDHQKSPSQAAFESSRCRLLY